MMSGLHATQHAILGDEYFTSTLLGTFGRSGIWKKTTAEKDRKQVHHALREHLQSLAEQYRSPVSDAAHLDNIRALANSLSAEFAPLFRDGRFRIGLAQKALNLYLKYLWCAGFSAQPPHCPVDAIVLAKAKIWDASPRTKLDSIEEYARLIERLRGVAEGLPLAEWDLAAWSAKKAESATPRRRRTC